MRPLVLYHGNCPDGFTAAWAVWRTMGEKAEYREALYGQAPPTDVAGREIILVDFTYPRVQLDLLSDVADAQSVSIYDHHATAAKDLEGWEAEAPQRRKVVFDMNRSGAGIAWDEFGDREHWASAEWKRPKLINYVEDRDLWRWALPDSREISEYLFSLPRTFAEWNYVAEHLEREVGFHEASRIGGAFLRSKRVRVEKVCENVRWVELAGTRVPVVNASWDMSELGEYLCEKFPESPCGGYYFDRADRRQWGFRSRGDFDVSTLCKQYGGGGHKAAAGFTSDLGWWP